MRRKILNPDESSEAAYGLQLRRSREAKGYTQLSLAPKVPCHPSYLSKIETATAPATKELSRRFDELLETGGTLELMWLQMKHSALIEGFPEFTKLEPTATLMRIFELKLIPGLLQTKGYATALEADAAEHGAITAAQAAERVAFRLARQSLLECDPAPFVHGVLDESCLRRTVGGPHVMAQQLRHLERAAKRPNITIQVLPMSASAYTPFTGHMTLLALSDRAVVGYTETMLRSFLERDRETVAAWSRYYDRLQAEALTPAESLVLIRAVRKAVANMTDAIGMAGASWLKSTYSQGGGNCVEIAPGFPGVVPVRDSKDPHGPALLFSTDAWSSFVAAVGDGELPIG